MNWIWIAFGVSVVFYVVVTLMVKAKESKARKAAEQRTKE